MTQNDLTYQIRGAIFEVHKTLGPGLLESVYHRALLYELQSLGLRVDSEVSVPIIYKGTMVSEDLKLDLLVEDSVIVELKSVEALSNLHKKQLLTYLRLTGKKIGLLVNFNSADMDSTSIIRIVNGL